jgi:DNA-directed RNA polymerase II subunit RPB2
LKVLCFFFCATPADDLSRYAAPLAVDVHRLTYRMGADGQREDEVEEVARCPLGEVPIMLKSRGCMLKKHQDRSPAEFGECPHDEGGYFVINGSEKVLIAQERINFNQIYIFKTPKGFFEAQIRSVSEKSTRPGLALYARCYKTPPKDVRPLIASMSWSCWS